MSVSRQWLVGDGGLRGVRQVKSPGYIRWQGRQYQSPSLSRFIGEFVFVEDFAGAGITVSQCLWTPHHFTKSGSPYAGRWICEFK